MKSASRALCGEKPRTILPPLMMFMGYSQTVCCQFAGEEELINVFLSALQCNTILPILNSKKKESGNVREAIDQGWCRSLRLI
jgi:hypothetical protein